MQHKQNKTIFLISSIGNLDGSVDFGDEVPQTFDNIDDALNAAKSIAEEYGMRTYCYKCTPIVRVDRGKLRVTKLGKT
jgi:hypothetical protein